MPLSEVLGRLEAMAVAAGADAPAAAAEDLRMCIICAAPREVRFVCGHALVYARAACQTSWSGIASARRAKSPSARSRWRSMWRVVRAAPTFVLPK